MKLVYNFLIILSVINCFSQDNEKAVKQSDVTFVKYSSYKELKESDRFKVDSIGFFINKNDTLIKMTGYDFNKGVKVAYEPKDSIFLNHYKDNPLGAII